MRKLLLSTALCIAAPICLATAASAQQTVTFLCAAPAGHVCQFAVQTGGSQMAFALPSGERKEVPGITPHADKYCVCDPGPVTPDCKAPRLDHWCMGSWLDVDTGLNSENEIANDRFAADVGSGTVGVSGLTRNKLTRGANGEGDADHKGRDGYALKLEEGCKGAADRRRVCCFAHVGGGRSRARDGAGAAGAGFRAHQSVRRRRLAPVLGRAARRRTHESVHAEQDGPASQGRVSTSFSTRWPARRSRSARTRLMRSAPPRAATCTTGSPTASARRSTATASACRFRWARARTSARSTPPAPTTNTW